MAIRRHWLALVTVMMLALGTAPRASAQDTRQKARVSFRQGVDAFEHGQYKEAYEAFATAYRISPHPSVQLNLGYCQELLGHPVEARQHFRTYLASQSERTPALRTQADAAVARVDAQIGRVTVELFPLGASLLLDEQQVMPDAAGGIDVAQGSHVLRARAQGAAEVTHMVTVVAGTTQHVRMHLSAAEPVAEAAQTPAIQAPSEVVQRPAAEERRSLRPWALGTGALTGAAVAGTIAFGVLAQQAEDDFDAHVRASNDPSLTADERAAAHDAGHDSADKANRLARASDAMLVTSVVAFAATTVLLVVQHRRSRDEQRAYAASVLPTRGGLAVGLATRF
jgi:hypothetical protein